MQAQLPLASYAAAPPSFRGPARPNPFRSTYEEAVGRLRTEQAAIVWGRLLPRLPLGFAPPPGAVSPKQKLCAALDAGVTQPDMVLAVIRETAPDAVGAIEALVGKPIQHLAEKASGVVKPSARAADTGPAKPDKPADPILSKIIRMIVDKNPKKPGSASALRFDRYRDGATVAACLEAGVTLADVRWDVAHKFVRLEEPR